MNKICGIYAIKNIINNKVYIGSSINIIIRWRKHKSDLGKNKHDNDHLQSSWNKYGKLNFEFIILEECVEHILLDRESFWIENYKSLNEHTGYNLATPYRHSWKEISKKKASISHMGEKNHNFGKKLSIEVKQKMINNRSIIKHTEEWKRNHSQCIKNLHAKGHKFATGHRHTEQSKAKMKAAAQTRPPISEEARQKISKAKQQYWAQKNEFKK